jgi:hypothetical protein
MKKFFQGFVTGVTVTGFFVLIALSLLGFLFVVGKVGLFLSAYLGDFFGYGLAFMLTVGVIVGIYNVTQDTIDDSKTEQNA